MMTPEIKVRINQLISKLCKQRYVKTKTFKINETLSCINLY